MAEDNPYRHLSPEAFWRSGVADCGLFGMTGLWTGRFALPQNAVFTTFGSCFAQHLSRALLARNMAWLDAEPAPGKTPPELAAKYNYGVFSARTGNIYTAAQLLTWARLAAGETGADSVELWTAPDGRVHDMLRPKIEPRGFASEAEARASIETTARAFRRSVTETSLFIFTMGLTEGWLNAETGQVYPICPGTGAGVFDAATHRFHNYRYGEILADMEAALAILRRLNPAVRFLLTVSPVPLTATASGRHVMVATSYSKSVLRAVAGDLAASYDDVDYFPSYEIIAAPPARAMFFEPNLRSVAPEGVAVVMKHFFAGLDLSAPAVEGLGGRSGRAAEVEAEMAAEDLVCEEAVLESFNEA